MQHQPVPITVSLLIKMLESHAVLQQLILTAPVAVVAVDRNGAIVFGNAKLAEMFGFSSTELIGQPVEILLPAAFRQIHVAHRTGYVQSPHMRSMGVGMDLVGQRKDSSQFPIEVGLSYLMVEGDLLVMASIVDITLRKHTEAMLEARVAERTQEIDRRRRAAERVQEILALINRGGSLAEILDIIAEQVVVLLNAEACAVLQFTPEHNQIEIPYAWRLPTNLLEAVRQIRGVQANQPTLRAIQQHKIVAIPDLDQFPLANDSDFNTPLQLLRQAGYRALLAIPLKIQEQLYGILVLLFAAPRQFNQDETTLAQTFAEQVALAIDNARYSAEVKSTAISTERSRIAHDLHDSVTQTLFSASVIADVLPRLWERKPEEGQRRLQELRELTRGALAEMRNLLLELRPEAMASIELPELLDQLAAAFTGRGRLPVQMYVEESCSLPPPVRIAFFRIAQEALNNVIKHAEASKVTLRLNCQTTQTEMEVTDDGRGFTPNSASGNHLGLTIMRERAAEIGAILAIESNPAAGTTVRVHWSQSN